MMISSSFGISFSIQVMDHKYKTLLRDMNIKFIMTEVSMKSIFKLLQLNYTNFFIMGKLETIQHVISMMSFSFRKYSNGSVCHSIYGGFAYLFQKIYQPINLTALINGTESQMSWEICRVAVEATT